MPGRKPGSRLTKRKEKRNIAKSTRTTKYANQKGGGSHTKAFKGRKRSDKALDQPPKRSDDDDDEGGEEGDEAEPLIEDDKAIRAFQQKLRQIEELKERKKRGDDLNDDQLEKIAMERSFLQKIIELTAPGEGNDDEPEAKPVAKPVTAKLGAAKPAGRSPRPASKVIAAKPVAAKLGAAKAGKSSKRLKD
ncbi:hypothetical protein T492DRAFT_904741 [Pavlovales sp. CCMP2436]|nr:hypothetical protein T492DRAFT_904741 [Pavlovales sp. CCMP2436]